MNDKTIGVDKENVRFSRRWINRQMEDFEAGERPRIIVKPSHGLKHQIPVTKVPITLSTNTAQTKQPSICNGDNNPKQILAHLAIPRIQPASVRLVGFSRLLPTVQCKNNSAAINDDR